MKVLIVGEHAGGKLRPSAGELVTAARQLGETVQGALLGAGAETAAPEFGGFGLEMVAVLGKDQADYSSDGFAAGLAGYVTEHQFDYVVLVQSFFGRDLGARLAAKLDAGWINDVTAIDTAGDAPVFTKPLYAGKVLGKFRYDAAGVKVLTLRPKNFAAASAGEAASPPPVLQIPLSGPFKSRVTAVEAKAEGLVDLKDADIIVSGGRGLGGPEGFEPLRAFAQSIGAALGASRATVDAGWIPHSHQVGQTGKVVNPKLYIACGISGAIQHLAGMQTSRCIVAVNTNENAPIFRIADYGIVGDVFEVVPELQKQLGAALHG
jgi:electron transfer flavoprotein alpha subunit